MFALSRAAATELWCECAHALPAATAALRAAGGDDAAARLLPCMRSLRDDEAREVKLALNASLAEIGLELSGRGAPLVSSSVLPLLLWSLERDEPSHMLPILEALPEIIELAAAAEPSEASRFRLGATLLPVVVNLHQPLALNWRWSNALIRQYGALTECVEPSSLASLALPPLFDYLNADSAAPNRREAVRVICMHLRKLRTQAQRSDACQRLVRSLCAGASYQLRIDFLYCCELLLDASPPCGCSHAFFKAHGLHHALLSLGADPVPNVRLHLCALLPRIRRTLRIPNDDDALQKLHQTVAELRGDAARDARRRRPRRGRAARRGRRRRRRRRQPHVGGDGRGAAARGGGDDARGGGRRR